jgi:hypothetical protein
MAEEIRCASCGVRFPPQNEHQGKMVVCPHCHRPTRNEPAGPPPAAENPYASPEAAASPPAAEARHVSPLDSPEIYRALAGTRRWVLSVAIIGFAVSGVVAFYALWLITLATSIPLFTGRLGAEVFLVPLVVAALVAFASWFPFRYGRRIGVFLKTQDLHDLERALSSQRTLWQVAGIAIGAAIVILGVVAMLVG